MSSLPLHPVVAEPDTVPTNGRSVSLHWMQQLGRLARRLRPSGGGATHAEVQRLAGSVSHLAQHSEAPFLELGQALQRIHGRARAVQRAATNSVQQHSEEVAGAWLPRLQKLVQDLEQQLEANHGQVAYIEEAITTISTGFAESRSSLHELNANVLTLRMLATMTRIESAHLSGNVGDSLFLAEEVGEQANHISDRADAFLSQSEGLLASLGEARERAEQLKHTQRQVGPAALRRASQALDALLGHRDATHAHLEHTLQLSQAVARHTGEVVSSLQFHDITRQRLEHVASALRQPSRGGRRGALLQLQASQLEHAGRDLWEASEQVNVSLAAIAESTQALSQHISQGLEPAPERAAVAPNGAATPLEQQLVEAMPAIQEVYTGAHAITAEVRALGERLAQVFSLHGSLITLAQEVEAITEAIKRVGINAAIRANALGQQGAPLGALAQSVLSFSSSVGERSRDLRKFLSGMDDAADRIETLAVGNDAVSDLGTAENDPNELLSLLEGVQRTFAARQAQQQQVAEESRSLAAEISEQALSFRAHHTLLSEMQRIEAHLRELAGPVGPADTPQGEPGLEALEDTYTMARERETHHSLLRDAKATASAILLVDGAMPVTPVPALAAADEVGSLGDNVELF